MKLILFFIANAIRIKYSLLLVLILLPTFFITNNHIHDWGDDFAQYIYQSQQINTPSDTYKQVLNVEEFSSPKRSLFFSMVLSSITPTHSISPYLNVIAILYIVAAVICFLFFTLNYSIYVSFIATLCLFYNFLFLRQKSEVLSEFLFIALFYITIHLIQLHKAKLKYIILVLIALLISVRFIGVSLLVAYIIHILFLKIDSKKQKAIDVFTGLIVVVLIMTCINFFIIPDVSNHEVSLYSSYTKSTFNVFTIPHNIQTYSKYILYFFEQEIPYYLNTIIKSLVVILFGVGFYFSVKKQFGIIDLALVCYIAFLSLTFSIII